MRLVGVVLTVLGVAAAIFSGAAVTVGTGLAFGLALTSAGFLLWVVGTVEDHLIEIRQAVAAGPGSPPAVPPLGVFGGP
jgi:hypothetical protein